MQQVPIKLKNKAKNLCSVCRCYCTEISPELQECLSEIHRLHRRCSTVTDTFLHTETSTVERKCRVEGTKTHGCDLFRSFEAKWELKVKGTLVNTAASRSRPRHIFFSARAVSSMASLGSLGGGIFRSVGSTPHTSLAYSVMVLSLENFPVAAMFLITILVHSFGFLEKKKEKQHLKSTLLFSKLSYKVLPKKHF